MATSQRRLSHVLSLLLKEHFKNQGRCPLKWLSFMRVCPLFPFLHFTRMQTKGNETRGAKLRERRRHGNLLIKENNHNVIALSLQNFEKNALDLMISVRLLLKHSWKPIFFQRDLKKRKKRKWKVTKMWMEVDKNGRPENLRSEGQSIYFKHVRYYMLTAIFIRSILLVLGLSSDWR